MTECTGGVGVISVQGLECLPRILAKALGLYFVGFQELLKPFEQGI